MSTGAFVGMLDWERLEVQGRVGFSDMFGGVSSLAKLERVGSRQRGCLDREPAMLCRLETVLVSMSLISPMETNISTRESVSH